MGVIASCIIAFATYSRIPMPRVEWTEKNKRYVLCFFPLIGAAVGAILALWLFVCQKLSLGPLLQGAVGALIPLLVTGGIHMDGFMDVGDAMASWQPRERRLEILKDSHVGAFGAMHMAIYLLAMAGLLSEAQCSGALMLGACFVCSRSLSACTSAAFKPAREGGMLRGVTGPAIKKAVFFTAGAYLLLCVGLWLWQGGWLCLLCMGAAALMTVYYRHMAYKYFGGVTGDLAGWFVQITELALTAVIVLGGKLG